MGFPKKALLHPPGILVVPVQVGFHVFLKRPVIYKARQESPFLVFGQIGDIAMKIGNHPAVK